MQRRRELVKTHLMGFSSCHSSVAEALGAPHAETASKDTATANSNANVHLNESRPALEGGGGESRKSCACWAEAKWDVATAAV